jgi:lipoprotein-anchoring transpeptidase ErfK/SrfK
MFESVKRRAALLAGVSVAVLIGTAPSHANPPVVWGATGRPPAYIVAPERAWPTHGQPNRSRSFRHEPVDFFAPPQMRPRRAKPIEFKPIEIKPVRVAPFETRPARTRSAVTTRPAIDVTEPKKPNAAEPVRAFEGEKKSDKSAKAAKIESATVPPGPLHVIVSVDAQRASLYANGEFVASTKVSTGTKSHPTPMGVFSVIQKNRHHISNLYGVPMPYMQRLTWSGTAMHTGHLPGYPASHGCIRLTDDFAQLLWKSTKLGARVIVTRDDVKPVEFTHAKLFAPKAPAPETRPEASLEVTGALVRTADARSSVGAAMPDAAQPAKDVGPNLTIVAPASIIRDGGVGRNAVTEAARAGSPVSVFISRKDGRLYVRQAMAPLFDLPLTVRDPSQPIGTHVYTAMGVKDGAMRWTAVSIPSSFAPQAATAAKNGGRNRSSRAETTGMGISPPAPSASAALDRIDIPQDTLDRLAGMITPGSSLIVSDNGLGGETGRSTDFIVLTR